MTQYQLSTWDLSNLYTGHESSIMEEVFNEIQNKMNKLKLYREILRADMDINEFINIIKDIESYRNSTNRLMQYAGLKFSENTQNGDVGSFKTKVENFLTKNENEIIFFSL